MNTSDLRAPGRSTSPTPSVFGAHSSSADIVELGVETLDELFHERDVDPLNGVFDERSVFDRLVDDVEPTARPLRLRIRVAAGVPSGVVAADVERAFGGFAGAQSAQLQAEIDRIRRLGLKELLFGLIFLAICLVAASAATALELGPAWFRMFIVEGLVIVGWIVLWHPVDMLFFERLPLTRTQRTLARIATARIDLRGANA